jgi:arginyl-tRNA synthetase
MNIFDQEQLRAYFRDKVREALGADPGEFVFEYPPNVALGDLAMNFPFALAKQLKRAPRQIAQEVVDTVTPPAGVSRMEAAGPGYINLFYNRLEVIKSLFSTLGLRDSHDPDQPYTIVEHTSINPNKAAHIGHLRNACLGDTLARLLRYLGRPITVQNYIDDTGVQVADVVVGFKHLLNMRKKEVIALPEPFDHFCWDLYARVGTFYQDDESRLELKKKTLHAMETAEGEEAELGDIIADRIVKCHLKTMERLGIKYDLLVWEGDILKQQFWEAAFETLKEQNAIYLAEAGSNTGCWVMDLSASKAFEDMDDPDKIIVRSDGTVTYVGKDIAYHMWKFGILGREFRYRKYNVDHDDHVLWTTTTDIELEEDYSPSPGEIIYNVIDVGQEYTQKVVAESIRAIAGNKRAEGYNHFSYEKVALTPASCRDLGVELEPGEEQRTFIAMSGRRGLGVKADDLVDMLIEKARTEVEQRNPDFTKDEIADTSLKIAVGALRFYMVKFTRKQVLAFDFESALSFEGESGPYLMYALVRANNIFSKLQEVDGLEKTDINAALADVDWAAVDGDKGADDLWELVAFLARMPSVASDSVRAMEQSIFAKYAYTIAQKFSTWYHKYPILHETDENLKKLRIIVLEIFRNFFGKALSLMGIEAPKRM